MAKNSQTGTVYASALTAVIYEGTVLDVSKAGVKIETRDFQKQASVERFFGKSEVVAHSDVGEGFVTVIESRPIAAYHGDVTIDGDTISVGIEGKRSITFLPTANVQTRIDFDKEGTLTSDRAKFGKRNSDKLVTTMRRISERSTGSDTKKKKKKKS